jgi:hypothetical protein
VLVIAWLVLAWYVTVFRRTRQKTPAATPEHAIQYTALVDF